MALTLPELPEKIQRKIVVSLPPKAFARTSILSKSWLSFYNSTRCSFNFRYYPRSVHDEVTQEIMNFDKHFSASLLCEKLSVEEFDININHHIDIVNGYTHELADLVYKWLAALFTKNNIVKVLRILIQTPWAIGKSYIPPEVFSNESLQVLHLNLGLHVETSSILDRVHSINLGCLRVLSLDNIDPKPWDRLLTACPILEQLTLSSSLRGQSIIIKGLHKLKKLDIRRFADVRIQEAPALENVNLIPDHAGYRTIINFHVCRRINFLSMGVNSERTATQIQQIVSCLPELENLYLIMVCATDITISSRCLKNLYLCTYVDQHVKMVKINAPNLRCYGYGCGKFFRHLMMKTGMLKMVEINLMQIEIDQPGYVLELRKALRMIEQLKLGVDTVKLAYGDVCVKASRLDEKLNVSTTRVIEILDAKLAAGAVMFDVDGNFVNLNL